MSDSILTQKDTQSKTITSRAADYIKRSWQVVPVLKGAKRPVLDAWQNLRLTLEDLPRYFNEGQNVGVMLGEPSGWLVDVDLDRPEALRIAPFFLPSTHAIFGRASKPKSHWLYRCEGAKTTRFEFKDAFKDDPDGACIAELRSTGLQTVFPPSIHPSGEVVTWHEEGEPTRVAYGALRAAVAKVAACVLLARHYPPQGCRQYAAMALAGWLLRAGWGREEVSEFVLALAGLAGDEEARTRIAQIKNTEAKVEADLPATGFPKLAEYYPQEVLAKVAEWLEISRDRGAADGLPPPIRDLGHALVLAELWRDRYRWADHRKSWMAWNGKRWEPITDNQVAAAASADLRAEYARRVPMARGEDEIKRLAAAVVETCFFSKINGALSFLKGMAGFHTNPEEWDADLWALNCDNGIIDLKTGELKPHTPAALCTKLAPVAYDPNAKSEKWEAHLKRFLPNPNIRRQVQRDLGLSLTGANLDEILPIWYGTGSNGKSTTAKVVLAVLGDYAETAPKDLLILQKHESHPTEIANLAGKRCVFASEIEQGARLNEAKVKLLTGGDKIKARFLFCDFFEFDQTWTITLFCNHKPVITGTDYAIWRRVRLVPWTVKIAEAEKIPQDEIIRELVAEGSAILKWLLDGFADWQQDHHWMADEVKAATEEYRQEQDRLAGFFADCCELGPHYSVAVAKLHNAYLEWCEQVGEEPLGKKPFGDRLRDRGITQGRVGKERERRWVGIRLADKGGQTFRKFSIGDDIEKVTETLSANVRLSSDREQPPENDIKNGDDPETWPTCRGCNRKVPEVDKAGLCDDCAAVFWRQGGG